MINVSEAYRKACESPIRQSYFVIKYGLYDKEAKNKISSINASKKAFSNLSQTYDEIKEHNVDYISCEPNRVNLSGSFAFIKDKNTINQSEKTAYWSNELSNSNCTFSTNPYIIYVFDKEINFTDLTLYFQEVVSDFNVKYYLKNNLEYTRQIRNNEMLSVQTIENKKNVSVAYFDKLEIEFIKTKTPYRYIKFNEIDFGVYQTFKKEEIKNLDIIDELSIDSSELSANSMNVTIRDDNGIYDILNPYNKLNLLQERQEMTCYHYLKVGNAFKEIPLGTFLLKNMQVENNALKLECYDDTYFMNKIYYGSKFYTNEECSNIFKDIFNYFGYSNNKYEIDSELIGIKLTGYIPQVEMREALRMVAEASGCVINKTRTGITYIFKTYDPSIKTFKMSEYSNSIPQRNLYNNVIDIVEYSYDKQSEDSILCSINITDISKTKEFIINFNNAPIVYDLYKDNFNLLKNNSGDYDIIELGATCCKVRVNSPNQTIELKGKYYIESSNVNRKLKKENIIVDDYAITKIDNKLITNTNSNEIAMWKLNRNEIKYSFDCLLTPYIEVGDTCKLMTKYKDLSGNTIKKEFIPTYINFTNSIMQKIEGE